MGKPYSRHLVPIGTVIITLDRGGRQYACIHIATITTHIIDVCHKVLRSRVKSYHVLIVDTRLTIILMG
jgi:hypothetical protein